MNVTEESFGVNLRIMRIFCLYPPDNQKRFFKVCSPIFYIFLTVPVPLLSILYLVFEEDVPVERIGDNAFLAVQMAVCSFKFMPFLINGERIKKCIHYFESLPSFPMTKGQKEIMDNSVQICRRNFRMFLLLASAGLLLTGVRPLFFSDTRFPLDVLLPFNATSELKIYSSVYLYVITSFAYCALSCALVDPLIAGLACLASAHIEIISDNLQNLDKYTEIKLNEGNYNLCDKDSSDLRDRIMYYQIRKFVAHYKNILDFVKEYEDCFSPVVFSQFVGGCLVLCFICFQLKLLNPLSLTFLQTIVCFCAMLVLLYFYCYYGTRLTETSENLTNAIYLGNWYDYDIKSKKALIILMEKSHKPITVTAGKLMDLSLETFATILRRSYSLFAFLQNQ